MLSDDVLQVADDPLSPKQPLIEMIIVAVPQLSQPGKQACSRLGVDRSALPDAAAIPCHGPLHAEQIVLARDGVPSAVAIAYGIRQTAFGALIATPGRGQRHFALRLCHRKHLPVALEFQIVGAQPALHKDAELPQLALVGAECGHIVHVPGVVLAIAALPDEPVKGLQHSVGKPLRRVGAKLDAVADDALDEAKDAAVFVELAHSRHHYFRGQALVKMPDVTAKLVLRAFAVVLHPALDRFLLPLRSPAPDASAAVKIHALHHLRLQRLNEGVMHILVRPLRRFTDSSPLPGAGIPALGDMGRFRLKALDEHTAQVFHPLRFGFFHPRRAGVGAVTLAPMVGAVDFINGKQQIIV